MAMGAASILNPHEDEQNSLAGSSAASILAGGSSAAASTSSLEPTASVGSNVARQLGTTVNGQYIPGPGEPGYNPSVWEQYGAPNHQLSGPSADAPDSGPGNPKGGPNGNDPGTPGDGKPFYGYGSSNSVPLSGMPGNPMSTPKDPGPVPPPTPPPAPPTPGAGAPGIDKAEKNIDEEQQHGFAGNILAGGMFQGPPELARNILLGN